MSKAKELLKCTGYETRLMTVLDKLMSMINGLIESEEETELFRERFVESMPLIENHMASLYEKFFTEEEMDLMIEWEGSPLGLKAKRLTPTITELHEIFLGELTKDIIKKIESEENL